MPKPDILQLCGFPDWDQDPLTAAYTLHRYDLAADKGAFLAQVGGRITAIVTNGGLGCSKAIIDACPNLRIITVYGVGYDAVDLDLCRARAIAVTNTPDVLTGDVADLAVAMMLAQARGLVGAEAWVRSGDWAARGGWPLTRRVFGRRVGILGLGRIGEAIARRCAAFDMPITYSATAPKNAAAARGWAFVPDPVTLAAGCDVLFVTLAASSATHHIVSRQVIAAVGPQGMIVNVSRAANIDEAALLDALEDGTLGAAALDVFEGEPRLDPRFVTLPNVLLQPHAGSGTVETRRAMGQMMRDNLAAFYAGNPLISQVIV